MITGFVQYSSNGEPRGVYCNSSLGALNEFKVFPSPFGPLKEATLKIRIRKEPHSAS